MTDWKIICLITPEEVRIRRLKEIYPDNYEDHIKNMMHQSETDTLNLPSNTVYLDTNMEYDKLKEFLTLCLKTGLKKE